MFFFYKKEKEYEKLKSTQRSRFAASGVALDGTPAAVLAQTDMDAELSAMEIMYNGNSKAAAYKQEADFYGENAGIKAATQGANTFLAAGGAS